jgi:hypothetical protein
MGASDLDSRLVLLLSLMTRSVAITGTSSLKSTKTMWNDFGLHSRVGHNNQGLWVGMLEEEEKTEIPTGMAVSIFTPIFIMEQLSLNHSNFFVGRQTTCHTAKHRLSTA